VGEAAESRGHLFLLCKKGIREDIIRVSDWSLNLLLLAAVLGN